MKARLTILVLVGFMIMSACTSSQMVAGPSTSVSVYAQIPLAPNVVLTVETPIITSPGPDYIWIDGYWVWDYNYRDYVWVQGYWALAPYEGAFWIPGYWEYYRSGYRWIDACWLPRDYRFSYGYHNGRYDYYGRPVYYDRPRNNIRTGYAYAYDNRPEYRSKGYSSSTRFNNAPKNERSRITREYQQQTRNSTRSADTDRTKQGTIRIRENEGSRESTNQKQPNRESSRQPATTAPSRTQQDNSRQNNSVRSNEGSVRSNESRSTESRRSGSVGTSRANRSSSSSGESSRVRNSNSSQNRSSGQGSNSRSSSSSSSRSSRR